MATSHCLAATAAELVNLPIALPLPPSSGAWRERETPEPDSAELEANPAPALDEAARERVLLDHLPLVNYVARRIHAGLPSHVDLEDLVSAGRIGLLDAFNKFDPAKKAQFRTYAQFRIRGAILDSLRLQDWGPRELRRRARQMDDAIQTLMRRLNRVPTELEIAAELEMPLHEYQSLKGNLRALEIGSLQELRFEDSDEQELATLAADPEQGPYQQCLLRQMSQRLEQAIADLPTRESEVIRLYYAEDLTMKEVGAVLGVVESRVSQIHSCAVVSLRARLARGVPKTQRRAGVRAQSRRQQRTAGMRRAR